eukprot:TRINITY_DN29153_c0_g1_i1.p1 TRINITY_DN29153_c0_g1~~TRINITY_DN29153_c0_g1_i1.p1  ORF type:complete len:708 (+),score=104.67 TRINITY_DN29153_c0_g1_i1:39-2162(+)
MQGDFGALSVEWQRAVRGSKDIATAVSSVEASFLAVCRDVVEEECCHFSASSLKTLLEIGRASLHTPGSKALGRAVELLHAAVVGTIPALAKTCGGTPFLVGISRDVRKHPLPPHLGCATAVLCDYVDLIVCTTVLRQTHLLKEVLLCPCSRCQLAVQTAGSLQANTESPVLNEELVFSLLCDFLELSARLPQSEPGKGGDDAEVQLDAVARAAEALAVLCVATRVRPVIPPAVDEALASLLRKAFPKTASTDLQANEVPSLGGYTSIFLGSVHVLRIVANENVSSVAASSEVIGDCCHQLWIMLDVFATEESFRFHAKATPESQRNCQQSFGGNVGTLEDARCNIGESSQLSNEGPQGTTPVSSLETHTAPEEKSRLYISNPQESDDQAFGETTVSGGSRGSKELPSDAAIDNGGRLQQDMEDATVVADAGHQYAEILRLYSLGMQALFHVDESLCHFTCTSEEAIRWQMLAVVATLRCVDFPPVWLGRIAFQCLRLYVLVCRSSHVRRNYAVLPSSFIEKERRAVATLTSLTPAADRDCILLHAMLQDIHGWHQWQAMELLKQPRSHLGAQRTSVASGNTARQSANPVSRKSSSHRLSRPERQQLSQERRQCQSTASAGKEGDRSRARLDDGDTSSAPRDQASATAASKEDEFHSPEDAVHISHLFTSGEFVWLIHLTLLALIIAALLCYWYSLAPRHIPRVHRR